MKKLKELKQRKWIILAVLSLAVIITAGFVTKSVISSSKKEGRSFTQSYEVTTGNVDSTVSATGNISMNDTTDVVAATGVIVKKVLVENGDEVKKGDTLAQLDKTSVVSELIEAKETKEDLEDQLEDDDLTDLEIEKINGEIEEINERISDLDKLHENPVIKADADGIVSAVNISEGSEISNTQSGSGSSQSDSSDSTTISTTPVSDAGSSAVTAASLSGSSTLSRNTASMAVRMSTTGISSAPETSTTVEPQSSTLSLAAASSQDDSEDNSNSDTDDSDNNNASENNNSAAEGDSSGSSDNSKNSENSSNTKESENKAADRTEKENKTDSDQQEDSKKVITDFSSLQITAPAAGNKAQTSISSTGSYTGTISWNPSDGTFKENTSYQATIILTAGDGYIFKGNYEGGTILNDGKQLKIIRTYERTSSASSGQNSQNSGSQSSQQNTLAQSGTGSKSMPQSSGSGGGSSLGGGGTASASSSASSATGSTTEFYGTYRGAAFSISTMKNAVVTVSIDELDILSIEKGQTAKVTMDALGDQEFEGTISKISGTATSSNGNTKYDVEITVPKADNMMDGMSASVVIVTDSAENAVIIPALALVERGEKQYVYTKKDDDGNLSGEVEVETGLSDGTNVAITNGLSEGDMIYYQIASGDDSEDMKNFGMQKGPGGSRPDGGFNGNGGPGGNGGSRGNGDNGPGRNGGGGN